ncbi:solute carrier family 22 member 18 isoform X2 [Hippopotamus amphibius kiboko]|uniref:solute carrier family 22 member 18 isoform X2 n=1 Tax=Hippopotamus amphibius kiboko TaxID=575201 RepID=UPI0025971C1B|nr:solute carrier family 22 member 18 isoform X2 [Hippopotamus amphibius kiboko]
MSRISLGGGGAHLGGPGHPERAGARVQPRKGPTGAHPRSALLTATVPKLTPAKAGSPTNTCPGCGKLGPPGTGASPPGGWALGASPGSCCSPTHWQPWSSPASSCSSPLCRFADQHGARAAFTLSFLAACALYLLLAAACSPALPGVALLFASRLPSAFMHMLPAAQMVITDLSPPAERPAALGRLGLCFGVGVIFGSLLGGTLSSACGPQEETMTVRGASPQCLCPQVTRAAWSWRSRPAHAAQRGQAREPSVPWRIAARPRPLPQPSWDSASWLPPPPTLRGRQDPYAVSTARGSGRIQCPVIMALVANLLGAALSFTCIPASTKGASAHAQASLPGKPKASVFDLKAITQLLLQPGVLPVFLVKVICSLPSGLFMVMFSIISMDFFQLEASQAGYLMSFFGILQMVIQGLVIGRLSSHFSEDALLRASVLVFSVVGLAMALMANVFHFCLLMPGLVFSLCALNVVTDSMLTKAVSASDTGTMLGLCASVQPLTRTLGPTLGGLLYRHFGVPVFGHVQFVVNFVVFLVLWRQPTPPKMDKAR